MSNLIDGFDELFEEVEKEIREYIGINESKFKGERMNFLDKETEELLKYCLDNEHMGTMGFPECLADLFKEEITLSEKDAIISNLKDLTSRGYISELQYAEDVPMFGRIDQKGRTYFKNRDIYIRALLKKDSSFNLLDVECEQALKGLIDNSAQDYNMVTNEYCSRDIVESLRSEGYIAYGRQGLSATFGGSFLVMVSLTRNGKNYFKNKEEKIEYILISDEQAITVTSNHTISNQISNSGNNCPMQIGTSNSSQKANLNFGNIDSALQSASLSVDVDLNGEKRKAKLSKVAKGVLSIISGILVTVVGGVILALII